MAKTESANKKAASRKIDGMVKNALSKHSGSVFDDVKDSRMKLRKSSMKSAFGNAMLNFQATVDHREQVGGFFYTFRKIWDGSLFNEEGIYIHSRLYAMNMSQVFVVIFFMVIYAGLDVLLQYVYNPGTGAPTVSPYPTISPAPSVSLETRVAQNLEYFNAAIVAVMSVGSEVFSAVWNKITEENPDFAIAFVGGLLNASSPDVIEYLASQLPPETLELFLNVVNKTESIGGTFMNSTRRTLETSYENYYPSRHLQIVDAVTDWLPSESEARIALSFGGVAAIIASISLALVWIPSSVNTIQMLRCGEISSLRSPQFQTYRIAPDLVTILFGSTFWGTIYSCAALLVMVALGALIVVWRITREFVISVLANVIGISVTFLFKIILLIFFRKMLFVGFFRSQPLGGNILLLMLECWSLGLTVGTMLIRFFKIMAVSAFYVGRLDTPLFAPGVGCFGPIVLDSHPIEFRKDLLIHEAHRHPYMERLAVIYLLKLRYGKEFGTRAGGQWRLIFVLALMPWLRRYRLEDGMEYDMEDSKEMIVESSKDDTIEVKQSQNSSIMHSKRSLLSTDEYHA